MAHSVGRLAGSLLIQVNCERGEAHRGNRVHGMLAHIPAFPPPAGESRGLCRQQPWPDRDAPARIEALRLRALNEAPVQAKWVTLIESADGMPRAGILGVAHYIDRQANREAG